MQKTLYLLLITIFLVLGCGTEQVNEDTLARVGDAAITRQDFEISYWLEPQYAIRTPISAAYQSQLNYLIDLEYYYLAAERSELAAEPDIQKKINYIEEKETLKQYIREKFLDTVRVSANELRTGLQRLSKKRYTYNIFRKNRSDLEKIKKEIKGEQHNLSGYFELHGQDLDWITFGKVDPLLEETLFAIAPGTASDIVASSYGYHILYVREEKPNPDFLNMPDQTRLENAQNTIRKRKAHRTIQQHLAELAAGQKIAINNAVINKVAERFLEFDEQNAANPQVIVPPLSNRELRRVSLRIDELKGENLARFGNIEISVEDFIERLRIMPPFHRPYLKGYNQLRQAILDMLRNELLLQAAQRENYDQNITVKDNVAKNRRELLSREFRARFNSQTYRAEYPEMWKSYDTHLNDVKTHTDTHVYTQHLFKHIADPDSVILDAPIPVMLQSRYQW